MHARARAGSVKPRTLRNNGQKTISGALAACGMLGGNDYVHYCTDGLKVGGIFNSLPKRVGKRK